MINRMDQSGTMVAPVRKVSKKFFAHLTSNYINLEPQKLSVLTYVPTWRPQF